MAYLAGEARMSDRKTRLYMVACCYRFWAAFPDERDRSAVLAVEGYADGQLSRNDLVTAEFVAWGVAPILPLDALAYAALQYPRFCDPRGVTADDPQRRLAAQVAFVTA